MCVPLFILLQVALAALVLEPAIPIAGFASFDQSKIERCTKTVTVLGCDGKEIGENRQANGVDYVCLGELHDYTSAAFVAVEDKRFYSHKGVDWIRVAGAIKNDLLSLSFREGASTITQQLVKNTHLSNKKTVKRKIEEIRIARKIERIYSKDEILEKYLNVVYFGNGIYGIEDAAERYFGKSASQLSLVESAVLAGIINNPSAYDPVKNTEKAIKRSRTVIKRMYEQGKIDKARYTEATACVPAFKITEKKASSYTKSVFAEAEKILSERNIHLDEYNIITFGNAKLNEKCEKIRKKYRVDGAFTEIVVCENKSGACIARAGYYKNASRSPGSTIKPFVCYAPAYEKKLIYPLSPIMDEKVCYGEYCPENADKKYHGKVNVNQSLINSYNIPAVKLLKKCGVTYAKSVAEKCGITFDEDDNSLAIALGAMKKGIPLEELAESYSTLARGGERLPFYGVCAVYDKNGKCVYSHRSAKTKAIGSDTAFLITDALRTCASEGTAKRLKNCTSGEIAAKTGTVGTRKGNTDAYCIAYTPLYTVAVRTSACGDNLLPNEICGATVPSSIAAEIMSELPNGRKFDIPNSVVEIEISGSKLESEGKIVPASACEYKKNTVRAWFSKNNVPFVYDVWFDGRLDNFDNFEIVDAVLD